MRETKTSKAKRIAAGAAGLAMLAVLLFSAFWIAAEADHDCCGEDCPICACVRLCESLLRGLACGAPSRPAAVVPAAFVLLAAAFAAAAAKRDTPVSEKVRLND